MVETQRIFQWFYSLLSSNSRLFSLELPAQKRLRSNGKCQMRWGSPSQPDLLFLLICLHASPCPALIPASLSKILTTGCHSSLQLFFNKQLPRHSHESSLTSQGWENNNCVLSKARCPCSPSPRQASWSAHLLGMATSFQGLVYFRGWFPLKFMGTGVFLGVSGKSSWNFLMEKSRLVHISAPNPNQFLLLPVISPLLPCRQKNAWPNVPTDRAPVYF